MRHENVERMETCGSVEMQHLALVNGLEVCRAEPEEGTRCCCFLVVGWLLERHGAGAAASRHGNVKFIHLCAFQRQTSSPPRVSNNVGTRKNHQRNRAFFCFILLLF